MMHNRIHFLFKKHTLDRVHDLLTSDMNIYIRSIVGNHTIERLNICFILNLVHHVYTLVSLNPF